jgi:hypothetical protein
MRLNLIRLQFTLLVFPDVGVERFVVSFNAGVVEGVDGLVLTRAVHIFEIAIQWPVAAVVDRVETCITMAIKLLAGIGILRE